MTEPVGQSPEPSQRDMLEWLGTDIEYAQYRGARVTSLDLARWRKAVQQALAATVRPPGDEAGLRAAAQAVVDSHHGQATGISGGPDPKPEDFLWYVSGPALDALRAALAAKPDREEPGLDVERLAEALQASAVVRRFVTGSGAVHRDIAVDVAAEYGRLATAPREEPADG